MRKKSDKSVPMGSLKYLIFVIPVIFIAFISQVHGSLPLTKECGEIKCQEYQYCDSHDQLCRPCSRICNTATNNFDEKSCVEQCQDHIHDERYIRNGNGSIDLYTSKMYRDLQQDIQTLKILVGLSVGLTVICLLAVIIVFIVVVKKGGDKKSEKPLELPNYNNSNKFNSSDVSSTLPSLKSPSTIGLGNNNTVAPMKFDNGPSTISQRFQREPSESTLPEYAYDNTSLSPTSHHV